MKRILVTAVAVTFACTAGSALFWGVRDGLSVLVGAGFAWVNFLWIRRGSRRIVEAPSDASPSRAAAYDVVRMMLILGGVFAMIHFSLVSLRGVVLGLAVFIFSTLIEALVLLVGQWTRKH